MSLEGNKTKEEKDETGRNTPTVGGKTQSSTALDTVSIIYFFIEGKRPPNLFDPLSFYSESLRGTRKVDIRTRLSP
jgi:hypothetical protein